MRTEAKYILGACTLTGLITLLVYSSEVNLEDASNRIIPAGLKSSVSDTKSQLWDIVSGGFGVADPEPGLSGAIASRAGASKAASKPHVHQNLHPDNLTLINITNIKFPINRDICNVSEIGIVTIVHTAVDHQNHRSIIRETWGNPKIPGVNTRLVFLTGTTEDKPLQSKLEEESEQFHDIVQADFHDSYHNLSYKNVFGKLWTSQFCEQAEFVVKTDDDMFLDLYGIYHISRPYLDSEEYKSGSFVFCPVWYGMPILRDKGNKWYVSEDELKGKDYPPYCTGWIYVLNPKTAGRLAEQATKTKFLWVDDAWVSGILVQALGFKHLNMMEWFQMSIERFLLFKSAQNPDLYHRDYLAAPNGVNKQVSGYLEDHARWCYLNKCDNNVYKTKLNQLNAVQKRNDEVLEHFVMKNPGYKAG